MSNITYLPQAEAEEFNKLDEGRMSLKPADSKRYLELIQKNAKLVAERDDKVKVIKTQVGDLKVTVLELFEPKDFTKETALDFMVNLQALHHFAPEQIGVEVPKAVATRRASAAAAGSTERGPQAAQFKVNGAEVKWPGRGDTPADVVAILNDWKAGKPINSFIALTDAVKKVKLIARIQRAT
ncbi:MAG TPA: hypothetical protein VM577_16910, partial [Anaerovoracaceae bacterium]|nr:hypothetical protein [Anaerovoracaceae bacterium]